MPGVAQNYILVAAYEQVKSTALNLISEELLRREILNVIYTPANDSALPGGFSIEDLINPALTCRNCGMGVIHDPTDIGLTQYFA